MATLSRLKTIIGIFAFLCTVNFPHSSCLRYGTRAKTLHFPPMTDNEKFGPGLRFVRGPPPGTRAQVVVREKRDADGIETPSGSRPATDHLPPNVTFVSTV